MKNESWIITSTEYLVRKDVVGTDTKGEPTVFPYKRTQGLFLEGFHTLTKRRLHVYGPFADLGEVETFAREHHIDIEVQE